MSSSCLPSSIVIFLLLSILAQFAKLVVTFGFEQPGASCGSNEYCPGGWSVLRRPEDYSAQTCNPGIKERSKCPKKPYVCVAAKCGISFCCANDKMLAKVREKESEERDLASAEREDAEERKKEEEAKNKLLENSEDL